MVSFHSFVVAIVALAATSVQALNCKQIGLVYEGFVGMGQNCERTCADRAYYARNAMQKQGDHCIASGGLSDVLGVQVTMQRQCTNPTCPSLVECQCKFGLKVWRAYKADQGSTSCNNLQIAKRLAANTPFAPVGWSNTNGDVHCSS
ncbi:hypothetical protein EDB81DRAFT_883494 [Dactylonectria macrodidyma]|uniref:Uncharacterized protein n=1 Tax=Dactylonectria macrodidyma TaxID=307937 RepID=A0A9P9J256_9HYPO|nr:hypothetical protein EDB81DRAFT_883494 [Dactylonectria macrodidyma]